MPFPQVVNINESATTTAGTSHAVSLPASLSPGNLLIIVLDKGSTAATFDPLAGYTELVDENLGNGITVWAHQITGAEGATVTFTSSASTRSAEISYQIAGAQLLALQAPELSTVATGASVNPNATACTPSGGVRDYLWITFFGMDGEEADDDTWVTGTPANYTNLRQKSCGVAGTSLGGLIGAAHRTATASSEDAGAFTAAVSANWRAYTIAVYPAPPPVSALMAPRLA